MAVRPCVCVTNMFSVLRYLSDVIPTTSQEILRGQASFVRTFRNAHIGTVIGDMFSSDMTLHSFRRRSFAFLVASFLLTLCLYRFHNRQSTAQTAPLGVPSPALGEIPHKIWQVFLGYSPFDGLGETVQSWVTKNQDYSYVLVSNNGANGFVEEYYSNRPHILQTYQSIKYPIFRSDLLRYMLLEAEGGVYSDLDTTVLKPVREWISPELQSQTRAIVGIEYDQLDDPTPSHGLLERISFCQWTLASSPGHPMMKMILDEVIKALNELASKHHTIVADLVPADEEVVQTTGPAIWSRVVFKSLSAATNTKVTYRNVTNLKQPRLFGDILVLPIDGFGTGQPHSGSNRMGADTALIRHQFKGSWKHGWSN